MEAERGVTVDRALAGGICIIGAGNVATHLARALAKVADVRQVVSRHKESAARVAAETGSACLASDSLDSLLPDADFYLIAVNDDAVAKVAAATPDYGGIWAHTSGSVPASVLSGKSRYGVFYPLQTFTRDVDTDMRRVPFFIEGSDKETTDSLVALAGRISGSVDVADSARRRLLHLAAVFACNFANLMWMEADEILSAGGLSVGCLMPLLEATLNKLNATSPRQAMTGPARRGDVAVIEKHLEMLSPAKREIYRLLSETIINEYHDKRIKTEQDEQDSL